MKKILLLGKNGQIGWELQRSLAPLGDLVALDRSDEGGDLSDLDALARVVARVQPHVIVNAAGYTAVDKAESEAELVQRINGDAPGVLARAAAKTGALLVQYSSDYVFDGSGERPWQEGDATGPLSVYGRTKLAGEQAIAASGCRHYIFRTSWVYAARGGNFAKTMLRLAAERDELKVISDQMGAPTGAELLADVTAHAIRHGGASSGIYHLAAAGETSWCDYARFVLDFAERKGQALKVKTGQVQAIPTSSYPTPARRPLNSRLNTAKLQNAFGLALPHWQSGVARMLEEILQGENGR